MTTLLDVSSTTTNEGLVGEILDHKLNTVQTSYLHLR